MLMNCPSFETKRLILREVMLEDRFDIFRNYSDPEVANWFFDEPFTDLEQSIEIIQEFIQKAEAGKGCTWAILLKETGGFIGTCGYENIAYGDDGEIGFDLARAHWGKGYMTEALKQIIAFGFDTFALLEVNAHTYSHNLRARRVLEKLGFVVTTITSDSHGYVLSRSAWME